MGLADASVGWAASANGLFLTTDQGRRWRTITPPNLANAFVAEHVGSLDAIGRSDLWLVLIDVPGLVPYSQSTDGSDRGEGIDRSTDGGRTWTFSALPGCLQACGANLTVSFVDPEHGFATNGPDDSGPTMLFATDDGGATWTPAGNLPDLGSILVGGPGPGPQMEFTSALDGWAVTGPLDGYDAKQVSPGGVLYRTVDGGTSWTRVSGLPAKAQYSLPTVFGTESAVVLSNPEGAPDQSTSVFVTHNDGQTWTAAPGADLERAPQQEGGQGSPVPLCRRWPRELEDRSRLRALQHGQRGAHLGSICPQGRDPSQDRSSRPSSRHPATGWRS